MKQPKEKKYFNCPIILFSDYLSNKEKCLEDARDYGIIQYCKNIKVEYFDNVFDDDDLERFEIKDSTIEDEEYLRKLFRFKIAEERFEIKIYDFKKTIDNGEALYNSFDGNKEPMTNISVDIWKDFYNNHKKEWDNIVFLAYLGVRSIIGNKTYCKVNYNYLFARMAGKRTTIKEKTDLPIKLQKYHTEYYRSKIRLDLEEKWHMKCYSGRGIYMSLKLNYEQLATEVKKRNVKYKQKENAINKKQINKMIDSRLKLELEEKTLGI